MRTQVKNPARPAAGSIYGSTEPPPSPYAPPPQLAPAAAPAPVAAAAPAPVAAAAPAPVAAAARAPVMPRGYKAKRYSSFLLKAGKRFFKTLSNDY